MAARYCNWPTNGKRPERDAFENGAYDTSTFTTNSAGTFNDQRTHTPGASFWIPTVDEWIKAAYYDPNRYGNGVEGYWLYNNQSNTAPIYNAPWNGGESNGGIWEGDDWRYYDVASSALGGGAVGLGAVSLVHQRLLAGQQRLARPHPL